MSQGLAPQSTEESQPGAVSRLGVRCQDPEEQPGRTQRRIHSPV